MATLQLKNKHEVAYRKLIREVEKDNGIPECLEVNGREAWHILNEIRLVGQGAFDVEASDEYDPQFLLKPSEEPVEFKVAEDLVTRWYKGDFRVYFKHENEKIPVNVIPEKMNKPKQLDKSEEKEDNKDQT